MDDSTTVSRRSFVRGAATLGALSALGAAAASNGSLFKAGMPVADAAPEEKVTWGHCAINCPGRCSLKFHVVDDEVVWVETYTDPGAAFEDPQPRACLRGRSYRRWLASPDRLSYPMKRVGKRGEGKFERISWEEAIDTAADKLKEVIEKYGNEAVYVPYATGVSATTARPFNRLLNMIGGCLGFYNSYSTAQISTITPYNALLLVPLDKNQLDDSYYFVPQAVFHGVGVLENPACRNIPCLRNSYGGPPGRIASSRDRQNTGKSHDPQTSQNPFHYFISLLFH